MAYISILSHNLSTYLLIFYCMDMLLSQIGLDNIYAPGVVKIGL